jgi:putative FmdB family regulatory protein
MPTYEYRCPDGHDFEKFTQKISNAQAELPCPTCGKVAPRRMSAGGGLLFKGSGFYITDYGKDGKKAAPKSGGSSTSDGASASSSGEGAKSETKSETKSEIKSEKKPTPPAASSKGGE